jgi:hypothetical protein
MLGGRGGGQTVPPVSTKLLLNQKNIGGSSPPAPLSYVRYSGEVSGGSHPELNQQK